MFALPKRYGRGTMTFPDERKYVWEFKDREQHGQGICTNLFTRIKMGR